jgi:hypothetical protein
MARYLDEHPALKPAVQIALIPWIGMAALFVQTTPVEKTALLMLVLGAGVWALAARRRRSPSG